MSSQSPFLFSLLAPLLSLSFSVHLSLSVCCLSHHFFSLFFLADALLTEVLQQLGSTVCLALMPSQKRHFNQIQCVQSWRCPCLCLCVCVCMCVCVLATYQNLHFTCKVLTFMRSEDILAGTQNSKGLFEG